MSEFCNYCRPQSDVCLHSGGNFCRLYPSNSDLVLYLQVRIKGKLNSNVFPYMASYRCSLLSSAVNKKMLNRVITKMFAKNQHIQKTFTWRTMTLFRGPKRTIRTYLSLLSSIASLSLVNDYY